MLTIERKTFWGDSPCPWNERIKMFNMFALAALSALLGGLCVFTYKNDEEGTCATPKE